MKKINYPVVSGILLLLFSMTYLPYKLEQLSTSYFDRLTEKSKILAKEQFQTIQHDLINKEVENLSLDVDGLNRQLNNAITESNETNAAMSNLLIEAQGKTQLLDSVRTMYDSEILVHEKNVDSLNSLFREKSNLLIDKMKMFNKSDLEFKLIRSESKYQSKFILSRLILLFAYILFFLFCFTNGIILFYKGFIQLKKTRNKEPEEFIQISDDN